MKETRVLASDQDVGTESGSDGGTAKGNMYASTQG